MAKTEIDRFRRMCSQFRWLATSMVISVGALLVLMHVIAPGVLTARGDRVVTPAQWMAQVVWAMPNLFYLFGVWSIGTAMGHLSNGRLIQPTLVEALRRVGVSLGIGGLISVFGVTNLIRLLGEARGGYLHFDVAGMTLGMIGGALFLLGRVVDQADRVQAELDEMI